MNTREEIRTAYSHVLDEQYPGVKINMPALVMMTLQILMPKREEWKCAEVKIHEVIKLDAEAGLVYISKGKSGGVCRPYRMTNLTEAEFKRMTQGWTQEQIKKLIYDFSVPKPVVSAIQSHPPVNAYIQSGPEPATCKVETKTAINDHTCPCCGNISCSKSERSCWKCGGSLH